MTEKEKSWFRISHHVDYNKPTFFAVAHSTPVHIELSTTRLCKRSKRDLGLQLSQPRYPKAWHTNYLLEWQHVSCKWSQMSQGKLGGRKGSKAQIKFW